MKVLLISKSNEYNTLLQTFYKGSDTKVAYTDTIDNLEEILLEANPNLVICDNQFGSIGVVQIKKIIDDIKPNVVITAVGDCFGNYDLDNLLDSGIQEFLCYNTDLRLTDRRIKSLVGEQKPQTNTGSDNVLVSDKENIIINLTQNTLYKNGKPINLTQLEYNLMVYFLENKNTLLKREDIVEKIWKESMDEANLRKVDSFVKKVRSKVDNLTSIKSVRGLGYRWEE